MKLTFSDRISRLLLTTALIGFLITLIGGLANSLMKSMNYLNLEYKIPLGVDYYFISILLTSCLIFLYLLMQYVYSEFFNFVEFSKDKEAFDCAKNAEVRFLNLLGYSKINLTLLLYVVLILLLVFYPLNTLKIMILIGMIIFHLFYWKTLIIEYKRLKEVYHIEPFIFIIYFIMIAMVVVYWGAYRKDSDYGDIFIEFNNSSDIISELKLRESKVDNIEYFVFFEDTNVSNQFSFKKTAYNFVEAIDYRTYEEEYSDKKKTEKYYDDSVSESSEYYRLNRTVNLENGKYTLVYEIKLINDVDNAKMLRIRREFDVENNDIIFIDDDVLNL